MIEVGPTLHATNSEENAASPSSSDDTKLGPIGGELRVRVLLTMAQIRGPPVGVLHEWDLRVLALVDP